MKPVPLSRIARWVGGQLSGNDVLIDAISTDTRTLDASDGRASLFVALKGDRFDGHEHLAAAADLGARALLIEQASDVQLPQVVVANTERALGTFAAGLQRTRATRVFAITGSNGKTSVKTLAHSILLQAVDGVTTYAYANPGNHNNEIGLPLAVICAPDTARYAIYEMGAGKPGDIAYLAAIARPHIALVNNIAPAHLERMGNLLAIADTKAAIYDALPADGVAVINADDAFAPYFSERAHGRILIRFGLDASADVTARDIELSPEMSRFVLATAYGEIPVELAFPGRHNVANAIAAASLALGANIPLETIAIGLTNARAVTGRLLRHRLQSDVVLIDDSYNANPGSLNAAIATLAMQTGEGWLVLGDMRELGVDAVSLHAEAGRRAKSAGVTRLYALGELSRAAAVSFGDGARIFGSHADLIEALRNDLKPDICVLVKGSRGSAMEHVVDALLAGEASHAA